MAAVDTAVAAFCWRPGHTPADDSIESESNSLAAANDGFVYRISPAVTARFHTIRFLTLTVLLIIGEGVGLKNPPTTLAGALNCFV